MRERERRREGKGRRKEGECNGIDDILFTYSLPSILFLSSIFFLSILGHFEIFIQDDVIDVGDLRRSWRKSRVEGGKGTDIRRGKRELVFGEDLGKEEGEERNTGTLKDECVSHRMNGKGGDNSLFIIRREKMEGGSIQCVTVHCVQEGRQKILFREHFGVR